MYTATITWTPAAADVDLFAFDGDAHATALARRGDRLEAILTVDGATPGAALDAAIDHCTSTIPGDVVAGEIITTAEHDRRLEGPARPELVGISEIAELLGVTRQRASALQTNTGFPAPAAVLRSGPVWYAADISRFAETWTRRPGRPSST